MDLLQLRVLREVARCGSISAAADALDYTQPAVSRQLAALERTAGRPLVERTARGTRLTRVGEVLLRRADTILAELEGARSDLDRLEEDDRRPVRLMAFATAIATFVPDALAAVRRLVPDVAFEVQLGGDTRTGPSDLRADRLDVALVNSGGGTNPAARTHLVHRDPFWCCVPVGHPLADREVVAFGDLRDAPFVLTADTLCADRALILDACTAAGFRPQVAGHCDDPAVALGLVAAGAGVAVLPEMALLRLREDVVLRPIAEPLARQVVALVPHDAPPRPGRDELVAALQAVGEEWRSPVVPQAVHAAPAAPTTAARRTAARTPMARRSPVARG